MNYRAVFLILSLVCTIAATSVVAQESMQGLARPEWQLRADLEFRLACQTSLQKLCQDLIQTHQSDPDNPANTDLLESVNALLGTKDGKLPTKIPDHPASIEYAKERRAAVVEWSKVYKAKGRDLPKVVLDAERKFQEQFQEADEDPANSPQQSTAASSGSGPSTSAPDISSGKSNISSSKSKTSNGMPAKRNAGNSTRSAEKKLTEATINSMVRLIQEVDEYRSFTPVGDTTLEKNAASEIAKQKFFSFLEAQPHYYLTYPIIDVAGKGALLTFTVEEPLEFDAIRKQIGSQLRLSYHRKEITLKTSLTQKMNLPIKPGDLLWVRSIVKFDGVGDPNYGNEKDFAVTHSNASFERTSLGGSSLFSWKTIVGFQVIAQSANAGLSK